MKELTSKKTGKAFIVDEKTYKMLIERGQISKYHVKDINPIKQIDVGNFKITPKIEVKIEKETKEPRKVKKDKNE